MMNQVAYTQQCHSAWRHLPKCKPQKHLKAKPMANDHLTATPMDHSGPIDSHGSETASVEQVDPSGN